MTDDELRAYLKPKHNWVAIGGFTVSLLVAAAGLARWAFNKPTPEEFQSHEQRLRINELDTAAVKANVDGIRVDVSNLKTDTTQRFDKMDSKLDKLLERRH